MSAAAAAAAAVTMRKKEMKVLWNPQVIASRDDRTVKMLTEILSQISWNWQWHDGCDFRRRMRSCDRCLWWMSRTGDRHFQFHFRFHFYFHFYLLPNVNDSSSTVSGKKQVSRVNVMSGCG